MTVEVWDVVDGLWLWRQPHPDWREGLDWEAEVASFAVESRGVAERRGVRGAADRRRLRPSRPRHALPVEPGRSLLARGDVTLYAVVTVKRRARTFVAVDGGTGDNLEPMLSGVRFAPFVLAARGRPERSDLVGPRCETGDVLVRGATLDGPAVSDLVAVPVTGACCHLARQQLQRRAPPARRAVPRGPRARGRAPRDRRGPARAQRHPEPSVAVRVSARNASKDCCPALDVPPSAGHPGHDVST